jgi:hypothetical protein
VPESKTCAPGGGPTDFFHGYHASPFTDQLKYCLLFSENILCSILTIAAMNASTTCFRHDHKRYAVSCFVAILQTLVMSHMSY